MPLASVIVPAHNEAGLILDCLGRIPVGDGPDEFEVIVVCNGCTDNSAAMSRTREGVRVVETPVAGKMNALNLGDAEASCFPRIYLDADAVVSADALRQLASVLAATDEPRVGSPRMVVEVANSTRFVREYFRIWSRLRYAQEAIGSGVYGLNEGARQRFAAFPDRGGDDQLVYRLFDRSERVQTEPSFGYVAPRTWRSLASSRARMFALNIELERTFDLPEPDGVGWREQGLGSVIGRSPRRFASALTFLVTQVVIKVWARYLSKQDEIPWNQDRTTR